MKFRRFIARVVVLMLILGVCNANGIGTLTSKAAGDKVSIIYQAHCQSFGWFPAVRDGEEAGITGLAKRMECLRIKLDSTISGGIEYSVHCQTYGWLNAVRNGADAGTTGLSKRLEAVKIKLTGDIAKYYDVYYRTHCQTYGWLKWVKNGEMSGTVGKSKRLEAIEIKLVKKADNSKPASANDVELKYRTHVESYNWLPWVNAGVTSGTFGQSKRLEGIEIDVNSKKYSGGVTYRVHSQTYGWLPWVKTKEMAGLTNMGKRMEAIQIYLTGELEEKYDIYYRVHCQSYGWLDWAKNGNYAGSSGLAKRLEAIEIVLVAKGGKAPGKTTRPYVCVGEIPEPELPEDMGTPDSKDDETGRSIEEILNGTNAVKKEFVARTGDPAIDGKVDEIIKTNIKSGMTNFEKVKAMYDWVINNNIYIVDGGGWRCSKSYLSKYDTWTANQSYSSLLLGYGSCKNYAAAFVVLTRALGFDSFRVCGHAPGSSEHGWALIRIDGKYYHFDPQLGDIENGGGFGKRYDFFGKTNSQFEKMGYVLCGDGDSSFEGFINGFNYFR